MTSSTVPPTVPSSENIRNDAHCTLRELLSQARLESHEDTLRNAGLCEVSHIRVAKEESLTVLGLKKVEVKRLLRFASMTVQTNEVSHGSTNDSAQATKAKTKSKMPKTEKSPNVSRAAGAKFPATRTKYFSSTVPPAVLSCENIRNDAHCMLSELLSQTRLESHEDALRNAGLCEVSHVRVAEEESLIVLGLKKVEVKRLLRYASTTVQTNEVSHGSTNDSAQATKANTNSRIPKTEKGPKVSRAAGAKFPAARAKYFTSTVPPAVPSSEINRGECGVEHPPGTPADSTYSAAPRAPFRAETSVKTERSSANEIKKAKEAQIAANGRKSAFSSSIRVSSEGKGALSSSTQVGPGENASAAVPLAAVCAAAAAKASAGANKAAKKAERTFRGVLSVSKLEDFEATLQTMGFGNIAALDAAEEDALMASGLKKAEAKRLKRYVSKVLHEI